MPDYQRRRPTPSSAASGGSGSALGDRDPQDLEGNAAMLARMEAAKGDPSTTPAEGMGDGVMDGPIGRVFQAISGGAKSFNKTQLKTWLDRELDFAQGEWFRDKKLDGVADALMAQLDTNRDGAVGWKEFEAFEAQTLATVAPGVGPNSRPEAVEAAAAARFAQLDNGDGQLTYDEIRAKVEAELPRETEHKSLVAQLAARIALYAVDRDQQDKPVDQRRLSRQEWTGAARDVVG
ncbi:MAG: hypothetical protein H6742_09275 [Alphaproteobacteria bacterium]|nr:hypothetical protein [Alphaproteobacteria bacterium]